MTQFLAIVAYRSLVAGVATAKLDVQVRWFECESEEQVRSQVAAEPLCSYANPDGEMVVWEFADIMAVERFEPRTSRDEVAGFIASIEELSDLT